MLHVFSRFEFGRDRAMELSRLSGNPIHQLELAPVLAALLLWEKVICGRCCLLFVDNEGARASLVSGDSTCLSSSRLCYAISDRCAHLGASLWYERVPTEANVADRPSRGMRPILGPPFIDCLEDALSDEASQSIFLTLASG